MLLTIFTPSMNHIQPPLFRAQWKTATGTRDLLRCLPKKAVIMSSLCFCQSFKTHLGVVLWCSCQRLFGLRLPSTALFHWQWLKETTSEQSKAYRLKILYTKDILLKGSMWCKYLCKTELSQIKMQLHCSWSSHTEKVTTPHKGCVHRDTLGRTKTAKGSLSKCN